MARLPLPQGLTLLAGATVAGLALAACLPSYTLVEGSGGTGTGATGTGGVPGTGGGDAGAGGSDDDPKNCGAAGHDCRGGACKGGVCQAFTLATDILLPTGIGVTEDLVVFSYSDGVATCPLAGCGANNAAKVVIAATNTSPGSLAVGGGFVYWTSQGAGIVNRCLLPTCPNLEILASGLDKPSDVALDAKNVYIGSGNGGAGDLRRCPLLGCGPNGESAFIFQPTLGPPLRVRVASGAVFWTTTDSNVLTCPPSGCPTQPAVLASGTGTDALALDAGHVYFGGQFKDVFSCPLEGCPGAPESIATTTGAVTFIVADDTHVYWSEQKGGFVRRAPIGGGPVTVIASGQDNPNVMAIDDKAVYWVNGGAANPGSLGCAVK